MTQSNTEISKFLSYILRHAPEAVGLQLDEQGWASIDELLMCAGNKGYDLNHERLMTLVAESNKKRFTISDDECYFRAAQGHSVKSVTIDYQQQTPPSQLYHETASRFLANIQAEGLIAKARHRVHLTADKSTAISVDGRYGKPVVLTILAQKMHESGFVFYLSENGVWLTEHVPAEFIVEDKSP